MITSDENIRSEIVNMVKETVGLESAVYKTLSHLLSLVDTGDEKDGDVDAKLQRSPRKALQEFLTNAADLGRLQGGVAAKEILTKTGQKDDSWKSILDPIGKGQMNAPKNVSVGLDPSMKASRDINQEAETPTKAVQREVGAEGQGADPEKGVQKAIGNFEGQIVAKKGGDARDPAKDGSSIDSLMQSGGKVDPDVSSKEEKQDSFINGLSGDSEKRVPALDGKNEQRPFKEAVPEAGKSNLQDSRKPLFSPATLEAIHDAIPAYGKCRPSFTLSFRRF